MINKTSVLLLCAVLIVAACVQVGGRSSLSPASAQSPSLQDDLQRGYHMLAEYEEYIDEDQASATHFKIKADFASRQNYVLPDDPDDGSPFPEKLKAEMKTGRAWLEDAMKVLRTPENTRRLAEAQVNYDCWLERVLDAPDDLESTHEKWCRTRFYDALGGLEDSNNQRHAIYFETASASLNDEGKDVIRQVTGNFHDRDYWRVRLTGYTDKNGDRDSNLQLSIRRAVAVRNALAQNGIPFERIVVDAMGEELPVESDEDRDEEESSRRVDVRVVAVYLDRGRHGKNPGEVFPMNFGEGSDF